MKLITDHPFCSCAKHHDIVPVCVYKALCPIHGEPAVEGEEKRLEKRIDAILYEAHTPPVMKAQARLQLRGLLTSEREALEREIERQKQHARNLTTNALKSNESWRARVESLERELREAKDALRPHVDPDSKSSLADGIRNLAQAYVTERDNAATLERERTAHQEDCGCRTKIPGCIPEPLPPAQEKWSPAIRQIIDQARKALLDAATDATFEERRKAWDLIRAAFFGR